MSWLTSFVKVTSSRDCGPLLTAAQLDVFKKAGVDGGDFTEEDYQTTLREVPFSLPRDTARTLVQQFDVVRARYIRMAASPPVQAGVANAPRFTTQKECSDLMAEMLDTVWLNESESKLRKEQRQVLKKVHRAFAISCLQLVSRCQDASSQRLQRLRTTTCAEPRSFSIHDWSPCYINLWESDMVVKLDWSQLHL
jgi:hypothetical protein